MKLRLVVVFIIMIVIGRLVFAETACDPTIASCLPRIDEAVCEVSVCFTNNEMKERYAAENHCQFIEKECSDDIEEIPLSVLQQIFPSSTKILGAIAVELNNALKVSEINNLINTKRKLAHFLAQVKQEVGASATLTENFNYKPSVLISKTSYFKKHPEEAKKYGRTKDHPANHEAIANRMYANGVAPGNGSVASGDGWKYRGRGVIQLTGKANYSDFNENQKKIWGDSIDFMDNPDAVLEHKYAVRSALVFWKLNGLSRVAEKGILKADSYAITKKVNRYTPSYDERFSNLLAIMRLGFFKECA